MNKTDYTYTGDTWWMTEKDCNECGAKMATNNRIYDCVECNHWEAIHD